MSSVKQLVESGCTSVPTKYAFCRNANEYSAFSHEADDQIPIIDFSLLTSGNPEQRSDVIKDLGNACREWGFFMVYN